MVVNVCRHEPLDACQLAPVAAHSGDHRLTNGSLHTHLMKAISTFFGVVLLTLPKSTVNRSLSQRRIDMNEHHNGIFFLDNTEQERAALCGWLTSLSSEAPCLSLRGSHWQGKTPHL